MIDLCKEPETNYFPSRQRMERLEGKSVVVLDVEEATGRPRLVADLHVAPNPRIGLFVSNNPVNAWDPLGLRSYGQGIQLNFASGMGFGGNFSIGFHIAHDDRSGLFSGWSAGILANVGVGPLVSMGPAFSVSGIETTSNADCVDDLKGASIEVGGSVNVPTVPPPFPNSIGLEGFGGFNDPSGNFTNGSNIESNGIRGISRTTGWSWGSPGEGHGFLNGTFGWTTGHDTR